MAMTDEQIVRSRLVKNIEIGVLLLIGAVVAGDGARFVLVTQHLRALEVGGYEILLGLLLVVLTLVYALRPLGVNWQISAGNRNAAISYALLLAFAASLHWIGYIVSTFAVVTAYVRLLGGYRLTSSLLVAAVFAIASTWLWTSLMISLPRGLFGTWIFW
jgi:hypothetical protein